MTAYEIIGTIAVTQIEENDNKKEIIKQIMKQNKNVKTIAKRTGEVSGPYRIKKVQVIAGENTTETIHKENGVRLKVDLNKAYFSPRLQTERQRIMNQVKAGEVIIDMFSGVGPYTIAIAKNTQAKKVYAIDHNQDAITYLKENITLNKITNVKPILGDSLKEIKNLPKADRVIMNAPRQNKPSWLEQVKKHLKKEGIIHYYTTSEKLPITHKGLTLINQRTVTEYAPGKSHECLDLKKTKNRK